MNALDSGQMWHDNNLPSNPTRHINRVVVALPCNRKAVEQRNNGCSNTGFRASMSLPERRNLTGMHVRLHVAGVTPCCQLPLLPSPGCRMHGLQMMHQHTVSHTSSTWIMTNCNNSKEHTPHDDTHPS